MQNSYMGFGSVLCFASHSGRSFYVNLTRVALKKETFFKDGKANIQPEFILQGWAVLTLEQILFYSKLCPFLPAVIELEQWQKILGGKQFPLGGKNGDISNDQMVLLL